MNGQKYLSLSIYVYIDVDMCVTIYICIHICVCMYIYSHICVYTYSVYVHTGCIYVFIQSDSTAHRGVCLTHTQRKQECLGHAVSVHRGEQAGCEREPI